MASSSSSNDAVRDAVEGVTQGDVPPTGAAAAAGAAGGGRDKSRLIAESGSRIAQIGHIGGEFKRQKEPNFLRTRAAKFEALYEAQQTTLQAKPREPITVTLPDGKEMEATSFETTPLEIAGRIASGLAKSVVVAKVLYSRRVSEADGDNFVDPEESDEDDDVAAHSSLAREAAEMQKGELWDLTRPLEGDCRLELKKFDDEEGRTVFWHSSAHLLGQCLERLYGAQLTIGPPTAEGFYYDCYMGSEAVHEHDFAEINEIAARITKEDQPYQRLVLTKAQALDLFSDNPFKVALISNKIPEGSLTTAYRCGPLVDLCRGPHVPSTAKIRAFEVQKNSAAYWLGNSENDSLQRVYAVAFPDAKQLKLYKKRLEEAKKRDHRLLGQQQELFFFHELSPGSAFWLPAGAHVYNKLTELIRKEYRKRGFHEVITPNVYNLDLWHTSGHAQHYLENMFVFKCEHQDYGLKPMNCPGHCLMFKHRVRSYRELPWRVADFGVLHRNEFSGALSGLTRVRRFQQDDAHIFCRFDQIKSEIAGVLDFIKRVYELLGFDYEFDLSTRPKKALGDVELWNKAETMMKDALEEFGRPWKLNPGDGAFYGPKIDIKVYDALGRRHQCATVQLDFQLPIRFDLRYVSAAGEEHHSGEGAASSSGDTSGEGWERPVMIHRAVLGSVERMAAVLLEHTAGKWPFWLSPRQVMVVPVSHDDECFDYANDVRNQLHAEGFQADVDLSRKTYNKKIREATVHAYNYILSVGHQECAERSVNIRSRANPKGRSETTPLTSAIELFKKLEAEYK